MKNPERFKNFASIMIAVVTVLSGVAACLATFAATQAGDADFEGLVASIKAQEADIVNRITVFEHYRAFTAYQRYNQLGNLLWEEAANADPALAETLHRLRREAWGVAGGLQYVFFPPRYINRDGSYDLKREFDELWADAAQQDDLTPEPYFSRADALRDRNLLLSADLIILAAAFWAFNLAQVIENRLKYLFVSLALLLTLAGIAIILLAQLIA